MAVDLSVEERDQLAVLEQQWPIVVVGNALISTLVAAMLVPVSSHSLVPFLWAAIITAIALGRWQVARGCARKEGGTDLRRRLHLATIGSGVSGAAWGIGLALLLPEEPLQKVVVALTLGGMAMGAAASLSSYLPAMYAYLVPCILPVTVRFFFQGTPTQIAVAAILVAFSIAMALVGRNLNTSLRRSLTLRHETEVSWAMAGLEQRVAQQTRHLGEANGRLTLEVGELQRALGVERSARTEAERANDAKSRFLAAASHDLRQPLQAMRLYCDLLDRALPPDGAARSAVSRLGEAMEATERLLSALMDVSTLDAGTVYPHVRTFPIQEVLDRLAAEIEPQANAAGIALRVRPTSQGVVSDPVLLTRILRNLLTNALRHAGEGSVLLGCRPRGRMLRIEVWDGGPGVPPEKVKSIFEDFVRLGKGRPEGCAGLGLGLAIVKRTAELLHHPFGVRSWPGRGSVFFIDVPVPVESKPLPKL